MSTKPTPHSVPCIDAEALDAVMSLPESDLRRAHLRECPRCHALAESYAMFLAPADTRAAQADDADRAFDALRAQLLAGSSASAPALRRSTWHEWFAPALRPAWALAALTILAGGALLLPRLQSSAPSHVLRGADSAAMALVAPAAQDGGVKLAWKAFATADDYTVVFYSPALEELARIDAGAQPIIVVPAARLPKAYVQGGAVLYRVVANRGGDEVARSSVGTIHRK